MSFFGVSVSHVRTVAGLLIAMAAAAAFLTTRGSAQPEQRPDQVWSVGYYTPTGSAGLHPNDFDWGALTHVTYAWALVRPDGSIDLATQKIPTHAPVLISAAHANGAKVLLGIGQAYWKGQTTNLRDAVGSNLPYLLSNIMTTVDSYGFDGVDIDWEPFRQRPDGALLKQFAAELRAALGTRLLSGAAIITESASWGATAQYFDRVGIMTYDMTGTWNPYLWHNAALYSPENRVWSIDLAVERFHNAGVPLAKISVGIPLFGYHWTGIGISAPQQALPKGADLQQIYYRDLVSSISAYNYRWDPSARVPFLTEPDTASFWTYDNEQSVSEKVRFVNTRGLGGWIIWELGADYLPNQVPNQPLLGAIRQARNSFQVQVPK